MFNVRIYFSIKNDIGQSSLRRMERHKWNSVI
nr:MAG TPA: hypothetical protein [Caudoviricetes sp.]